MDDLEKRADEYSKNLEKDLLKGYDGQEMYGMHPELCTIPTPHVRRAYIDATKIETESLSKQLTKAKKILKYVLNSFVGDLPKELGFFDEEELKAIAEVEQFLSEVENDRF